MFQTLIWLVASVLSVSSGANIPPRDTRPAVRDPTTKPIPGQQQPPNSNRENSYESGNPPQDDAQVAPDEPLVPTQHATDREEYERINLTPEATPASTQEGLYGPLDPTSEATEEEPNAPVAQTQEALTEEEELPGHFNSTHNRDTVRQEERKNDSTNVYNEHLATLEPEEITQELEEEVFGPQNTQTEERVLQEPIQEEKDEDGEGEAFISHHPTQEKEDGESESPSQNPLEQEENGSQYSIRQPRELEDLEEGIQERQASYAQPNPNPRLPLQDHEAFQVYNPSDQYQAPRDTNGGGPPVQSQGSEDQYGPPVQSHAGPQQGYGPPAQVPLPSEGGYGTPAADPRPSTQQSYGPSGSTVDSTQPSSPSDSKALFIKVGDFITVIPVCTSYKLVFPNLLCLLNYMKI